MRGIIFGCIIGIQFVFVLSTRADSPKHRTSFVSGNCKYHVNVEPKQQFPKSNDTCQRLNGSLIMLKSLSLQDELEEQIVKQYDAGGHLELWVGGHQEDGIWFWMDGTRIPTTGPNQKWKGPYEQYMILSSFATTRDDMDWYSKNKDNRGFICEVAVEEPCKSGYCGSHGTCVATGCQANCHCSAGYSGDVCQNESMKIVADKDDFTIVRGQNVTVTVYVTSHDGAVAITVLNTSNSYHNIIHSVSIIIGPLLNQTDGDVYLLRATPESVKRPYHRYLEIIIRVEDLPTTTTTGEPSNKTIGSSWVNTTLHGEVPGGQDYSLSTTTVILIVVIVLLVAALIGGLIYRRKFARNFQCPEQVEMPQRTIPSHEISPNGKDINLPTDTNENRCEVATNLSTSTPRPIPCPAESLTYENVGIDEEGAFAEYEVLKHVEAENPYEVCDQNG